MKTNSLLIGCLLLVVTGKTIASANRFFYESERLVAASDKTFTVIATQYEQAPSYWASRERLFVRVLDMATNTVLSETLISSVSVDRGDPLVNDGSVVTATSHSKEPTLSVLNEESPAISALALKPQALYNNLEYPRYKFHIDDDGVYINNNGRQQVLALSKLESRFPEIKAAIEEEDLEFTGWYKMQQGNRLYYFLVLKLGLCDCDLDSMEYVFSVAAE